MHLSESDKCLHEAIFLHDCFLFFSTLSEYLGEIRHRLCLMCKARLARSTWPQMFTSRDKQQQQQQLNAWVSPPHRAYVIARAVASPVRVSTCALLSLASLDQLSNHAHSYKMKCAIVQSCTFKMNSIEHLIWFHAFLMQDLAIIAPFNSQAFIT